MEFTGEPNERAWVSPDRKSEEVNRTERPARSEQISSPLHLKAPDVESWCTRMIV